MSLPRERRAIPRAAVGSAASSAPGRAAVALALCGALVLAAPLPPAKAVEPDEILSDAQLEGRARKLSSGLRCLVCQNQSIDDSNAPLARDLRILVRERLKAGDSDKDVLGYIVARYGEFVLLRPTLSLHTILLWLAPLVLLAGGVLAVRRSWARAEPSGAGGDARALSAEEKAALDKLLAEEGEAAASSSAPKTASRKRP